MNRRRFAHAASVALLAGCGASEDVDARPPDLAGLVGFRMPDEAEAHERTWMGFTSKARWTTFGCATQAPYLS